MSCIFPFCTGSDAPNIPGDLDNSTNNVLIPLDSWTSGLLVYRLPLSVEYGVSTSTGYGVSSSLSNTSYSSQHINTAMTKVIKGEFEKIKDIKVEDDSLAYDSSLEVFNCGVSRLSKMDDDLFTYEVEIDNIPCDLRVDDEVELTDEEFSDNEDEITEVFRIDTNIFNYETPICLAFNEFNYLLKVDTDLLTKDIMRFKTYDDYKDDWIYK
ncbi:hypothetical protein Tco_0927589 [Tanacetum coccineum]